MGDISKRFQERQEQEHRQAEEEAAKTAKRKRRAISRAGYITIGVTAIAILGSMPVLFSAIAGEPLDPDGGKIPIAEFVQDYDAEEVIVEYAEEDPLDTESPKDEVPEEAVESASEGGAENPEEALLSTQPTDTESLTDEVNKVDNESDGTPVTAATAENVAEDGTPDGEGNMATAEATAPEDALATVDVPTIQSGRPLSAVQDGSTVTFLGIQDIPADIEGGVSAPGDEEDDELADPTGSAPVVSSSVLGFAACDMASAETTIANGIRDYQRAIDISDYGIMPEELTSIIWKVVNDNPEMFYVSSSVQYSYRDNLVIKVYPTYLYDQATTTQMTVEFNHKLDEMASWASGCSTDAERIKAMHDYLCRHVSYDHSATASTGTDHISAYTAYGALVNHQCVCQGYTLALRAGLNRLGIIGDYVLTDNHIWNIVQLNNNWYHVDVTSDDPGNGYDSTPRTTFFIKSDAYLHQYMSVWQSNYQAMDISYDSATWQTYPLGNTNEEPGNDPTTQNENGDDDSLPSQTTFIDMPQINISTARIAGITTKTYTGKAQTQNISITKDGTKLTPNVDYTVAYSNNTNAGTAKVIIKAKGFLYTGSVTRTFTIKKATNPITAKAINKSISVAYSPSATRKTSKNISVQKAQGAVTYSNSSTNATAKKFVVDKKTGTVTIPSKTKSGTYQIRVSATAAGNNNYVRASKVVSYNIVIKPIANPLTVTPQSRVASFKTLKTKVLTVARPASVTKSQGTVTYTKTGGSRNLTINKKTGQVTVRKGTPKGRYAIQFTVTATGNANYTKATKTVKTTIVVK